MKTRHLKTCALILLAVVVTGNRPDCDRRQETITCNDMYVSVTPGSCADITNPCDPSGDFSRVDGFRLCNGPDGIFVRTNRSRSGTTRQICAASNVAALTDFEAEFIYATPGDFGKGKIFITTTGGLSVIAGADKSTIDPGEAVNLTAAPSGGTPPYSYSWSSNPPGEISLANSTNQNPVVNPNVNVTYTVSVTGDHGNTASDDVSVGVNIVLITSAQNDTIDPGGSTQMVVIATGGDGNYTYSWSPITGLNSSTIADPIASPSASTAYTCTVEDGVGGMAQAMFQIIVRGVPGLTACFTATPNPAPQFDTITFDATCSIGTIIEYRWWFFGDPDTEVPVSTTNPVSMAAPFDLPGTYPVTLEVVEQGTLNTARVTHDVVVQ